MYFLNRKTQAICQCTLRDVTTLYPPLGPYVIHRHTSLEPLPFECDVIYGRPQCTFIWL